MRDNTNSGALFKNDRKTTDNHPDLSGRLNVDGKDFWLSAWTKRNEDGSFKLLSLSIKPKDDAKPAQARKAAFDDFADDDLPNF